MRPMIKRIFTLFLTLTLLISALSMLASCKEKETRDWPYTYDPYYNRFKDEVPGGKIKVKGNEYLFSSIEIRDKDENMLADAQNSLAMLYELVIIEFIDEDTVEIVDYSDFFRMPATKGEREGNILTVKDTNETGDYTYDIRIEIHKEKIVLIHNAHFYDTPGTYATVTFDLYVDED